MMKWTIAMEYASWVVVNKSVVCISERKIAWKCFWNNERRCIVLFTALNLERAHKQTGLLPSINGCKKYLWSNSPSCGCYVFDVIYVASLTIHVFHRRREKKYLEKCKRTQWRHSDNDVFIMPRCIHITIQAMRKKANHHHHILQPSYLLPRKRETVFFLKKRILMIHNTTHFM